MAVYDPDIERKIRARLPQFELVTKNAGRGWRSFDLAEVFPTWMGDNKHRDQLFANPTAIQRALQEYQKLLTKRVRAELAKADEGTVVALLGAGSLFGLWSVSELISMVSDEIKGILLVFFPGRHEGTVYKLMDARSSWNYLALPIEARSGGQ